MDINVQNNFISFYNNVCVQKYIKDINSTFRGDKGKPLATLISFNFYKDKIHTFKLYGEIFREFTDNEIELFLPTAKDFQTYFPYWNNKRDSSLCFGIKLDYDYKPIYYTHIKFDPNKKIYEKFPQFKTPSLIDVNYDYKTTETGISFEYYNKQTIEKRYWYFHDEEYKKNVAQKFNLSYEYLEHIEYTEYKDNKSKVILVYDYPQDWGYESLNNTPADYVYKELKKYNYPIMNMYVDFFKSEFNLYPKFFGTYSKDGIVSVYWSLTKDCYALRKPYLKEIIIN